MTRRHGGHRGAAATTTVRGGTASTAATSTLAGQRPAVVAPRIEQQGEAPPRAAGHHELIA
jgi:hypothetical protein